MLARLDHAAPLIRTGLIDLSAPPESPWLARSLVLDEIALNGLLGRTAVDTALGECARLLEPAPVDLDAILVEPDVRERLQQAQSGHANASGRLRILLSGPHGAGKFALANALAYETALRLLVLDARQWTTPAEARAKVERAGRLGLQCGAVIYLHGVTGPSPREPQFLRAVMAAVATLPGDVVVVSSTPLAPVPGIALDALRIELGYPGAPVRLRAWQRALAARGRAAERGALELLAQRFSMGAGQIEQAVADIEHGAHHPDATPLPYVELALAARAQCGAQLAGLAQRIVPAAGLAALVVPPDVRAQLGEICARVTARETVRRDWAAGSVHARVVGVTALFAGPSGTGKTMAAEVIANELGFDLYRIDLASIVSKYIGETENNLDRVFAAAEHANAVLFFDEADALFGKRSEVKDAHDRYANIEIAYLLQKMEQFDGIAILATNLKQNLDEAFARRLTFTVNFPFPEAAERKLLWASLWPPRAPRAADVDLEWFATEYRLSGGNIRNTILAAAHLAAADGCVVTRTHLLHATRREFQKLGKSIAVAAHAVTQEAHG